MLEVYLKDDDKLVVIGDIHEHQEQFDLLVQEAQKVSKNIKFVSVGDVYDKGFGTTSAEKITNDLISLNAYAVQGNHEIKNIKKARKYNSLTKELLWWKERPLVISFIYPNQSRITVVHGGVLPSHNWESLGSNIEICYIRTVDENGKMIRLNWVGPQENKKLIPEKNGMIWHQVYDGRFGYIASGHDAQKDGKPKFYNHSCNLDSACYETGILTAQIFSSSGREDLIQVKGTPRCPELNGL